MSKHPHNSDRLTLVNKDLTKFLEQPPPLTAVWISGDYPPAPPETFSGVDHVKQHMKILQEGLALSLKAIIEMQKSLESMARVLTTPGINERQMPPLCQSLFLASINMLGDPKCVYNQLGVASRLRTMASQLEQALPADPPPAGKAPSVVVPGLCTDVPVVPPGELRGYAAPARIVASAAVDLFAVTWARDKVIQVEPRDWQKERQEIEENRRLMEDLLQRTVHLRMNGDSSLATAVVTSPASYSLLPANGGRQIKLIADLPPALREGKGHDLLSGWPFQKNSAQMSSLDQDHSSPHEQTRAKLQRAYQQRKPSDEMVHKLKAAALADQATLQQEVTDKFSNYISLVLPAAAEGAQMAASLWKAQTLRIAQAGMTVDEYNQLARTQLPLAGLNAQDLLLSVQNLLKSLEPPPAVLGKRPAADSPAREQKSAEESSLKQCEARGREIAAAAQGSLFSVLRVDEEELVRQQQKRKVNPNPAVKEAVVGEEPDSRAVQLRVYQGLEEGHQFHLLEKALPSDTSNLIENQILPSRLAVADAAADLHAVIMGRNARSQIIPPSQDRREMEVSDKVRPGFRDALLRTVAIREKGGPDFKGAVVSGSKQLSFVAPKQHRVIWDLHQVPAQLQQFVDSSRSGPALGNSAAMGLGKRAAPESPGSEVERTIVKEERSALPQTDGAASEDEAEDAPRGPGIVQSMAEDKADEAEHEHDEHDEDEDEEAEDEDEEAEDEDEDDEDDESCEDEYAQRKRGQKHASFERLAPPPKQVKFEPSAPPAKFRGIGHRQRVQQRRQQERREQRQGEPRAEPREAEARGWPVDLTKLGADCSLPLYEWAPIDMELWTRLAPFKMDPPPHGYNLNVSIGQKLVPRAPPRLLTRWELAEVLQEANKLHAEHTALVAGLREDQKRDRARDITPEDRRWEELFARLQRLGYPLFTKVPIDPHTQNFFGSHY